MSSFSSLKGSIGIRFGAGNCKSKARIDGKTAIITGGNTGIGKETAIDLAKRGGRIVICCRNAERAETAVADIKSSSGSEDVHWYLLDLSSLQSVRDSAAKVLESEPRIDILINNAGLILKNYSKTVDGLETHMATNHLGHFLFTLLLLPTIRKSENARIVNVSSILYQNGHINFDDLNLEKCDPKSFDCYKAYANSKLGNVLFTRELAKRLENTNIRVFSVHPGLVHTEMGRDLKPNALIRYTVGLVMKVLTKNSREGAQTTIHCAVSEDVAKESGLYYEECKRADMHGEALNDDVAKQFWELSLKLVGFSDDYDILRDVTNS